MSCILAAICVLLVFVKSKAFEIKDYPFLISVADPPELIVSYIAILCAGEKGDGGLNELLDALDYLT